LATAPVWKGEKPSVDVGIQRDLYVTVPRGTSAEIKTAVDLQPRLIAPLTTNSVVGELRVMAGNQKLASAPAHPLTNVALGSWWRRLIDTIRLWFA
jgi:D-alanyl-D-alanine carboxypeptidase (penicillin-binding protein 5/6)